MTCKLCGVAGHEPKDCSWAKAADAEIYEEIERRLLTMKIVKMERMDSGQSGATK